MILEKLNTMEREAQEHSSRVQKRVHAIKSLQDILSQIDFSVEEVPLNNRDNFQKLLVSLKNDNLSDEEGRLITEIINFR